jgi:hypothetical protein
MTPIKNIIRVNKPLRDLSSLSTFKTMKNTILGRLLERHKNKQDKSVYKHSVRQDLRTGGFETAI